MSGTTTGQRYSHLRLEERCRVPGRMEMGLSVGEIGRRLGRHRSNIQRELTLNRSVDGYRPNSAERRAWSRKLRGSMIARSTRCAPTSRTTLPWDGPRSRSRGGWSSMDRSTQSARSALIATPTAPPGDGRGCPGGHGGGSCPGFVIRVETVLRLGTVARICPGDGVSGCTSH